MEVVVTVSFVISLLFFLFLRRIRQAKVTTINSSKEPNVPYVETSKEELHKSLPSKRKSRTIISIMAAFLLLALLFSVVTSSVSAQSSPMLMLFIILFIPLLFIILQPWLSRLRRDSIDIEISGNKLRVEGTPSKEQQQLVKNYMAAIGEAIEVNSLTIPTKIYEGDSNIVLLRLAERDALVPNGTPKAMFFVNKQGLTQPCEIEIPSGFTPKSIEIELLAVGFDVEGERRQKHEIFYAPMIYQWNISPTHSGNLEIGLVFRAEDASGQIGELGVITHKINVVKILGLTGRQIGTLTNIFGAVGGVLGVIVTLNQLGVKFP